MAAAMLGEMLDDFLHWRNPWKPGSKGFYIFGLPSYYLVTALFNVFPLPRQRDFQRSFAHAGKALDHGYNVLVFPEGTLSRDGSLAPFRSGIGLLAKQSFVPVLPMAMLGLGEIKTGKRGWFRPRRSRFALARRSWLVKRRLRRRSPRGCIEERRAGDSCGAACRVSFLLIAGTFAGALLRGGSGCRSRLRFWCWKFSVGQSVMSWAGGVVTNMLSATFAGTQVLFGQLGLPNSGAFGDMF